jgi:hypothetical protein
MVEQRTRLAVFALVAAAALGASARAAAQPQSGYGQVSLFGSYQQTSRTDGGPNYTFSEISANVSLVSKPADDGGFEYGLDARGAEYPSSQQTNRVSLYNAWIGGRLTGGRVGLRAGQMWLNDLGGLGSVGGVAFEAQPFASSGPWRLRFGLFGGLEPDLYQIGYVSGVKKYGGYAALDGVRGWKNVLGYVQIRDQSVTERSVVTMLNFIPIGRDFFLYQAAEIDTTGPAGTGGGPRLTYIFVNARYRATPWLEFQGLYHHGTSIDTRSIAQDILNGRPVDPRALEGFLFGSIGGRVTIEPLRNLRFWGGYSQEQSSGTGETYPRYQAGISAMNVFGSGLDLTASDYRYNRPSTGSYDSIYASIGRSIGPNVYLTLDYTTSLSVLSITNADGVVVQSRPRSKRFALQGVVNLSRAFSVILTAEQIRDDTARQFRGLAGITFRF